MFKNKAQKLYTVALQNQFFKSLIAWNSVNILSKIELKNIVGNNTGIFVCEEALMCCEMCRCL